MAQVDTRQEVAPREGPTRITDVKGRIIEYAFWMQKEGYAEATVARRTKLLELLTKRGAILLDSESVKSIIAKQATWGGKTKELAAEAYSSFLRMLGMSWRPPNYRPVRKLPLFRPRRR